MRGRPGRRRDQLVSREAAEAVEGVGVPPARELIQKLLDNQVPVYV